MEYRRFVSFNVFGGILWVLSMTLIGYYLGQFPWVKKNIEIVIIDRGLPLDPARAHRGGAGMVEEEKGSRGRLRG